MLLSICWSYSHWELKNIPDSRIWSFIYKGPIYRFPSPIYFNTCRKEIAGTLQECCNLWCKREHVESNALKCLEIKLFFFSIIY